MARLQQELVRTKLEVWGHEHDYRSTSDDNYCEEDERLREKEILLQQRLWNLWDKENMLRKIIEFMKTECPSMYDVSSWLDEHQKEIDNCPVVLH